MNLIADPVVALEAHDQRPPLVGVDPVGEAVHQDVRMNVNTRDADFEGDDLAAGDVIVFHEVVFRGNDSFHLDRALECARQPNSACYPQLQ